MEPVDIQEYRQQKKKSRRKLAPFLIYLFLIILGTYSFLHSSFFQVRNLQIKGHQHLSETGVIDLIQLRPDQNLIFLPSRKLRENILISPLVKEVEMERKIPNTLIVTITERQPVGLLVCSDGFIQISEDGYFLSLLRNIGEYSIPIINGISMDYLPGPGQKIENETLLMVLNILKLSNSETLKNLAEINIANVGEVVAYTTLGVEIKLGDLEEIEEKLQNLNLVLTEIIDKKISSADIEYIDLRFTGAPIIRRKL